MLFFDDDDDYYYVGLVWYYITSTGLPCNGIIYNLFDGWVETKRKPWHLDMLLFYEGLKG